MDTHHGTWASRTGPRHRVVQGERKVGAGDRPELSVLLEMQKGNGRGPCGRDTERDPGSQARGSTMDREGA